MVDLAAAYRHCARTAAAHDENFPVASWLLPPPARPHVAAIYAFARGADDLADEGHASPTERLAALAAWQTHLHRASQGDPCAGAGADAMVFVALAESIRVCQLPLGLFDDLVSAFMQDVAVTRYDTWTQVLDYCRRSANPIGRLVLRVCGYNDGSLDAASDRVCSALQLTNFWQDLQRDWQNGRLYVPRDVWQPAGASESDFDPRALTPAWRRALVEALNRTESLFDDGKRVCDGVSGRLRYELRLTWLGGTRVLERLRWRASEATHERPALGLRDLGPLAWRLLRWDPAARAHSAT